MLVKKNSFCGLLAACMVACGGGHEESSSRISASPSIATSISTVDQEQRNSAILAAVASSPAAISEIPGLYWFNSQTGTTVLWSMYGTKTVHSETILISKGWRQIFAADLDGNGTPDVVWNNPSSGENVVFLMDSTKLIGSAGLLTSTDWRLKLVGDFNGDGKADLLWNNPASGQTVLWLMDGSKIAASFDLLVDKQWEPLATADLDADGKADLIWSNATTHETVAWLMNGGTVKSGATILTVAGWSLELVADLNGDGKDDLIWNNSSSGETIAWLMDGLSPRQSTTLLSQVGWHVQHSGDLNGDGRSDLIWNHAASGQTVAWLMDGIKVLGDTTLLSSPDWSISHTVDLNGDGKSDLLWFNPKTGQTVAWLMNGTKVSESALLLTDANFKVNFARYANMALATTAPLANAGAAKSVVVGATVLLDGTLSSSTGKAGLNYNWEIQSLPAGSKAALVSANSSKPQFTADLAGEYVLALRVTDGRKVSSLVTTTITAGKVNQAPTANFTFYPSTLVGQVTIADGVGSFDPDGDTLDFKWSLSARPPGSFASLIPAGSLAGFIPDLPGSYVLDLIVSDGKAVSSGKTATIVAQANTSACYASAIASSGPFLGNSDEVFKTMDGKYWRVGVAYNYLYEYYPVVTICPAKGQMILGSKAIPIRPLTVVAETRIANDFNGWSYGSTFVMANGQIWKQTSSQYRFAYKYAPVAVIFRDFFSYELSVDGMDETVIVQRLN